MYYSSSKSQNVSRFGVPSGTSYLRISLAFLKLLKFCHSQYIIFPFSLKLNVPEINVNNHCFPSLNLMNPVSETQIHESFYSTKAVKEEGSFIRNLLWIKLLQ